MRFKSGKTYLKNIIALVLCIMFFCLPMMGCADIFSSNNSSSNNSSNPSTTPGGSGGSSGSGGSGTTPSNPTPPTPSTPEEEDHTDDYTSPDGDEEYLPIEDMFYGFNILSEDKEAIVYDNISGTYKTFNNLLERQTETLADDILHRLNAIWGDGLGANYNLRYSFRTTDNDGYEYATQFDGKVNKIKILTSETLLPFLQPEGATTSEFTYQHTHEDLNNNYINCPGCYAINLTQGNWQVENPLGSMINLSKSISGDQRYFGNIIGFTSSIEEFNYKVTLTVESESQTFDFTDSIEDDTEITYIELDSIIKDTEILTFLKDNLIEGKICSIKFDQAGSFIEGAKTGEATIESTGTSYTFRSGTTTVNRYYLDYPIYAKSRFMWNWCPTTNTVIINNNNRDKLQLAIANILASGQPDTYNNLEQCFNNIDHLGILSDRDNDTEFNTDAQKIVEYVLNNIIGQTALDTDNEALNALTQNIIDNQLTATSTIPVFGHYYKGYQLLVPEVVETAIHNCYINDNEEGVADTPINITKAINYPAYPLLPRVSSSYITFDSLYKKTQDMGGDEDEDLEGEEGEEEEEQVQDVYWMPTPTLLRNITFLAKTDARVIEQWFAFEAYRRDSNGGFLADIEVEVQINITYVQNGEVMLDNVLATESSIAEEGILKVTKGLYDFDNNDNSVDLNVIDLLDDSVRWNKMGKYNGDKIPDRLELFNSPYNVTPTSSYKTSSTINVGDNYIQFSFTPISAYIVQGDAREEYHGDVYFRLAIFDTIY